MDTSHFLTRIGIGLGVVKRKQVPVNMRSVQDAAPPAPRQTVTNLEQVPAATQKIKLPIGETEDIHTVMPASFKVVGDIVVAESMVLQGVIQGNVEIVGEHQLVLGRGAGVHGNVKAKIAVIGGEVEGDLMVERLIVLNTAIVHGNIEYSTMTMADGATVNGTLKKVVPNVVAETQPQSLQNGRSESLEMSTQGRVDEAAGMAAVAAA